MRRVSCAVAIGCFLAASLTAEAVLAQPHLTLGVNRTTLSAQTPAVQEKTLNDIQGLGASGFATGRRAARSAASPISSKNWRAPSSAS